MNQKQQRMLADAMAGADFVQINDTVFQAEYLRAPDDSTVPEDVVMELKLGDSEVAFTLDELDDAHYIGDGVYRLKTGVLMRFLTGVTIH